MVISTHGCFIAFWLPRLVQLRRGVKGDSLCLSLPMDKTWIIFTILTIAYIIAVVVYFARRSKSHEAELRQFLETAQEQLNQHKTQAEAEANQKVTKAMAVVKKVEQAAHAFEDQAQKEYEDIIEDAKTERRELLAKTKAEIEELFKKADVELEEYQVLRQREIEKNLVKLVVAVTEKVVEVSMSQKQHQDIIMKALQEVKQKQSRV